MSKRNLIKFFVLIFNISVVVSQPNLSFDYDYAIFRDEGTKVYLELYYSFSPSELLFMKN